VRAVNMRAAPMIEVHLLRLPVQIWKRAQEHSDELLREFTLLTEGMRHEAPNTAPPPLRLIDLVEELTNTYAGFSGEQEAQLFAASADGKDAIDLRYTIPAQVGDAATRLGDALDEADEYCRAGQHLLTLATPPDLVHFRRWFLDEFTAQAAGRPPTPWPDYAERSAST